LVWPALTQWPAVQTVSLPSELTIAPEHWKLEPLRVKKTLPLVRAVRWPLGRFGLSAAALAVVFAVPSKSGLTSS